MHNYVIFSHHKSHNPQYGKMGVVVYMAYARPAMKHKAPSSFFRSISAMASNISSSGALIHFLRSCALPLSRGRSSERSKGMPSLIHSKDASQPLQSASIHLYNAIDMYTTRDVVMTHVVAI